MFVDSGGGYGQKSVALKGALRRAGFAGSSEECAQGGGHRDDGA